MFRRSLVSTSCHKYGEKIGRRREQFSSNASTESETIKKSTPVESKLAATQKLSSPDLLEKLIAGLSGDIHQKNRVYKNDLVRVINKVKEMNFSTKRQGLLLIRCCTELLPDETPSSRMELVELIWNTIK